MFRVVAGEYILSFCFYIKMFGIFSEEAFRFRGLYSCGGGWWGKICLEVSRRGCESESLCGDGGGGR